MKKAVYIAIVGLLLMFLMLNIASSQAISPLYFGLVKGNTQAAVSFLQKISRSSGFNYYKGLFSADVQKQFTAEETKLDNQIKKLESLLQKNPNARDVLYNLHLLYTRVGNDNKAQEYLKRAQEIDPTIK